MKYYRKEDWSGSGGGWVCPWMIVAIDAPDATTPHDAGDEYPAATLHTETLADALMTRLTETLADALMTRLTGLPGPFELGRDYLASDVPVPATPPMTSDSRVWQFRGPGPLWVFGEPIRGLIRKPAAIILLETNMNRSVLEYSYRYWAYDGDDEIDEGATQDFVSAIACAEEALAVGD